MPINTDNDIGGLPAIGRWLEFEFVFDAVNKNLEVYLDGNFCAGARFKANSGALEGIGNGVLSGIRFGTNRISAVKPGGSEALFYFDDLSVCVFPIASVQTAHISGYEGNDSCLEGVRYIMNLAQTRDVKLFGAVYTKSDDCLQLKSVEMVSLSGDKGTHTAMFSEPIEVSFNDIVKVFIWDAGGLLPLSAFYIPDISGVYYLSPDGDDKNPGSQTKPWRTLGKAAASLHAGDTVILKDGVYFEQGRTTFLNSGANGAEITMRAENKHGAKVVYPKCMRTTHKVSIPPEVSYITIQDIEFTQHSTANEDDETKTKDIMIQSYGDNCSFIGNKIYNCFEEAIKSVKNTGTLIENNIIFEMEHEGIDVFNCDRAIIRGNNISEVGRCGIMVKGGSRNTLVYNNYISSKTRPLSAGFHVGGISNNVDPYDIAEGTGSELYNSIFYNNIIVAASPGKINVGMYYISSSDCHCYNNIMSGVKSAFCFSLNSGSWGWKPPVKNAVIKNNIIYKCNEAFIFKTEPENLQSDYNLYFETYEYPSEPHSINANPLFINENSDFRLKPASPAIGAGEALPESFTAFGGGMLEVEWIDFAGNMRDELWDIGAYNAIAE